MNLISSAVISVIIPLSTLFSTVHRVPADYTTIQAALVNSSASDTVLVAAGTYYEHIVWPNAQGIVLMSDCGAESTIIDALGALRPLTIEVNVDTLTEIRGFTFKNGAGVDCGGGIYCYNAAPKIINNIITNNQASGSWGWGGGIYCYIANISPVIRLNRIQGNSATHGGGIMANMGPVRIIGNTITGNSASVSGSGIEGQDADCVIEDNEVSYNGGLSSGLYFFKSNAIIMYNDIFNNNGGITFNQAGGTVNYNNIYYNGYGLDQGFREGLTDARNNWWGDATGPYHDSLNPGGMGDTVSDYVDFIPWLNAPYGITEQKAAKENDIIAVRPNPFRNTTVIYLGRGAINAEIKIYDEGGRLVKDLTTFISGTSSSVRWDGVDSDDRPVPTGIYFVKAQIGPAATTGKLILLR